MSTRATIQDYFGRLADGGEWESLLSDGMVFTSFTSPVRRVSGRDAFVESTRRFYSMIQSVDVRDLVVDGTTACALTTYELMSPSGQAFTSDVAEIFEVGDGLIASLSIYFDSAPFPK
jgi:ketosteroid isomerase-like protein